MVKPRLCPIDSAYLWLRRGQAARVLSRRRFLRALSNRETTLGPPPDDLQGHVDGLLGALAFGIAAASRP